MFRTIEAYLIKEIVGYRDYDTYSSNAICRKLTMHRSSRWPSSELIRPDN